MKPYTRVISQYCGDLGEVCLISHSTKEKCVHRWAEATLSEKTVGGDTQMEERRGRQSRADVAVDHE